MKKLVLSAAVLTATMMFGAGAAQAAVCGMYGKVVYVYASSSNYCVFYVVNNNVPILPTYARSFYSSNDKVCELAAAAQVSGQTVYASGATAASTCPSTSTVYASMGDYSYMTSTSLTVMKPY